MERLAYPGSFRPFHEGQLDVVKSIITKYPNGELTVLIADKCKRGDDFIKAPSVKLAIDSSMLELGLKQVKTTIIDVNPLKFSKYLVEEKIDTVFSGSTRTLALLNGLKKLKIWDGNIQQLDNSGIHGTEIRNMIKQGNSGWEGFVTLSMRNILLVDSVKK